MKAIKIKQEYEFVRQQTKRDRVRAAITKLGGVATIRELAAEVHMSREAVSTAISQLPVRRIPPVLVLLGVVQRCPSCHQPWPEKSDA